MRRTFILCVGAQKAGTTWLWKGISRSAAADFGPMKEYHVWDALSVPECADFRVRPAAMIAFSAGRVPRPDKAQALRWSMQTIPGFYEAWFARMARRHERQDPGAGHFVTGDFTPSYCGLGPEALARIRQRLERKGFEVKVLFIMRDPAARCLSAARMKQQHFPGESKLEAVLAEHFASPAFALRTRYDRTARNLDCSFDADNVLYLIYEEMFSAPAVARISEHIGIGLDPAIIAEKHNVGEADGRVPDDLIHTIRQHYAPVYEYCAKRFPETQTLWNQPATARC